MDAMSQKTHDRGRATMYRTLPVKLTRRKKFPTNPKTKEMILKTTSLNKASVSMSIEVMPRIAMGDHNS